MPNGRNRGSNVNSDNEIIAVYRSSNESAHRANTDRGQKVTIGAGIRYTIRVSLTGKGHWENKIFRRPTLSKREQ